MLILFYLHIYMCKLFIYSHRCRNKSGEEERDRRQLSSYRYSSTRIFKQNATVKFRYDSKQAKLRISEMVYCLLEISQCITCDVIRYKVTLFLSCSSFFNCPSIYSYLMDLQVCYQNAFLLFNVHSICKCLSESPLFYLLRSLFLFISQKQMVNDTRS